MKTSSNGRALIERYEGLILQSYDDANDHIVPEGGTSHGTLTIGYGHTSAAGAPKVVAGMKITKEEADSILASDLIKVEADVTRLVKVQVTQNQYDALVSFHFNTGSLGKSTLLKVLNNGNYKAAADHFMDYTKGRINGKLVQMNGLIRRRKEEQALFLKKSNITGPITGATATAGLWATMSQYFHAHPYLIASASVAIGVGLWALVHYMRNK